MVPFWHGTGGSAMTNSDTNLQKSEMCAAGADLPKFDTLALADCNPYVRLINLYPCAPGFDTGDRILCDHYLLYVHAGKGAFMIRDTWYEAQPGDLYYCPPCTVQRILADREDPFLLTGVDFDLDQSFRNRTVPWFFGREVPPTVLGLAQASARLVLAEGPLPDVLHLAGDRAIQEGLVAILAVFEGSRLHGDAEPGGLLKGLLARLYRRVRMERSGGSAASDRVEAVVRHLAEHHGAGVTCEALAERFHYHPDHLNRLVKAYSGLSLKRYLTGLRIREALTLLRETREPIAAIAERMGFSSPAHFSRVFREETGHAPSAYRRAGTG